MAKIHGPGYLATSMGQARIKGVRDQDPKQQIWLTTASQLTRKDLTFREKTRNTFVKMRKYK